MKAKDLAIFEVVVIIVFEVAVQVAYSGIPTNSLFLYFTLASALDGVSASDTMMIKLDNWTEIETITSADSLGYKEIALAKTSKWAKFKIILNGYNVAIEELQIINAKHK